jgi:hypothetical protein
MAQVYHTSGSLKKTGRNASAVMIVGPVILCLPFFPTYPRHARACPCENGERQVSMVPEPDPNSRRAHRHPRAEPALVRTGAGVHVLQTQPLGFDGTLSPTR